MSLVPSTTFPRSWAFSRGGGIDLEDGGQKILDDLVLRLLAGYLDLTNLRLGLLVCFLLGLLVALCVLDSPFPRGHWSAIRHGHRANGRAAQGQ
jgi:hypothetical protein